jgi:hypothetical protein
LFFTFASLYYKILIKYKKVRKSVFLLLGMLMLGTFTFTSCTEDDDFTTKTNLKPNNENYISQTAIDFAKSIKSQGSTRSILSSSLPTQAILL